MQNIDVAVIGAGPAGLTAGIYLGRARLKTVIFEKALAGGQMAVAWRIENFPGFNEGISGTELAEKMRKQALECGAEIVEEEIIKLGVRSLPALACNLGRPGESGVGDFMLKAAQGKEYHALAVIIATGSRPKKLGVPGEDEFLGLGVSYCATCDAPLFREKTVVVVGGGDAAAEDALFLAEYCKKVYLVHRRDRLRAAKILAERIGASKKIELVWNSVVTEITGDKKVKAVKIQDVKTKKAGLLACDGVFIFAGIAPNSGIVKGLVELDKDGYVITDQETKTSFDGIFAAGDIRKKLLRQVVTACGEAATAAVSAQHYVEELKQTAYD